MILATSLEPIVGIILAASVISAFGWIIYRIFHYFNTKPIKRLYPDEKPPSLND